MLEPALSRRLEDSDPTYEAELTHLQAELRLTRKLAEVAYWRHQGLSERMVAIQLGVKVSTVHERLRRIYHGKRIAGAIGLALLVERASASLRASFGLPNGPSAER